MSLIRDAQDSDVNRMSKKKAEQMLSRTPLAIWTRAKKAKAECQKFDGLVNVVKAAKPTGDPKEEDIEKAALAILNKDGTVADIYRYLRGDESPSKPFPFAREYAWYKKTNGALLLEGRAHRQNTRGSSSAAGSVLSDAGSDVGTAAGRGTGHAASTVAAVNEAVGKKASSGQPGARGLLKLRSRTKPSPKAQPESRRWRWLPTRERSLVRRLWRSSERKRRRKILRRLCNCFSWTDAVRWSGSRCLRNCVRRLLQT